MGGSAIKTILAPFFKLFVCNILVGTHTDRFEQEGQVIQLSSGFPRQEGQGGSIRPSY